MPVAVDLASLPERLREEIEGDPKLAESWSSGAKLGGGADTSASGLDFGLMAHLARRGRDDELIRLAIRHYPHGQIGGGKLSGWNAERRIEGLLREAEGIRAKAQHFGEPLAWYGELVTTNSGAPRDCVANGALILRKDPVFVGQVLFDEHRGAVVCWDLPWCPGGDRRPWTGTDDVHFAEWCQVRGVPLKSGTCAEAVTVVADGNRVHPVREYLDGLEWDGVARLNNWLATYAGVTTGDATYVREVGRRWMISAVARVFRPGCKADAALILEGGQGAGKSSLLRALVPSSEWFADEIADLGSKDSAQDLSGKWLIELAELSALRRGDVERVKAFMSRSVDHYRPSYGRRSQDFARQCVFAGSTNSDAYLADETGNRRFWPVQGRDNRPRGSQARPGPALGRGRRRLQGRREVVARPGDREAGGRGAGRAADRGPVGGAGAGAGRGQGRQDVPRPHR